MMDFTHIDGRDWPIVRHKDRSIVMKHGRDYITLSDGIHLTAAGMFRLGQFTDDIDLITMAIARGALDNGGHPRRVFTPDVIENSPLTFARIRALRQMHEEGER